MLPSAKNGEHWSEIREDIDTDRKEERVRTYVALANQIRR